MLLEIVGLLVCTMYIFLVVISIQTPRIRKGTEFELATDETPPSTPAKKKRRKSTEIKLDGVLKYPEEAILNEVVVDKYRGFFKDYPNDIWGEYVKDYETEDQFYDYINKHIIFITKTERGLKEDMKTAYEEENRRFGGLRWFLGNIIITTIDNVYIAIRLSKIFLNNNLVNPANRKELIQNTLDDFSRNAIGFENNLVLDKPQPNTNDLQVLSSHDFTMIKSDYDIERKGFLRECRHINEYKQIIETIIVLMELELKNHKSYGCIKGKRDNEYKDFKGYWDNFIEIFPDRDGADLVAETLIHAYEFNPNGMTRVFDNTESYEDKQNRVSKNMGKSTAVEIQKLDVYKQYHKRLHDLINDKGL